MFMQRNPSSLLIEHECPNLDGLSLRRVGRARCVQERRVRRQACFSDVGVVALDECHFVRPLVAQVIPLQVRVVFHCECPANSVWVNEAHRNKIVLGIKSAPVRDS